MKKFLSWMAGIALFGCFLFAIFFGWNNLPIPSKVSEAKAKLSLDLNMNTIGAECKAKVVRDRYFMKCGVLPNKKDACPIYAVRDRYFIKCGMALFEVLQDRKEIYILSAFIHEVNFERYKENKNSYIILAMNSEAKQYANSLNYVLESIKYKNDEVESILKVF